jgi:hypothetical protein
MSSDYSNLHSPGPNLHPIQSQQLAGPAPASAASVPESPEVPESEAQPGSVPGLAMFSKMSTEQKLVALREMTPEGQAIALETIPQEEQTELMEQLTPEEQEKLFDAQCTREDQKLREQEVQEKLKKDELNVKAGVVIQSKDHIDATAQESDTQLKEAYSQEAADSQKAQDASQEKQTGVSIDKAGDDLRLEAQAKTLEADMNVPLENLTPVQAKNKIDNDGLEEALVTQNPNGKFDARPCEKGKGNALIGTKVGSIYAKAGTELEKILRDPKTREHFFNNHTVYDAEGKVRNIKLKKAGPAIAAASYNRMASLCFLRAQQRAILEASQKRREEAERNERASGGHKGINNKLADTKKETKLDRASNEKTMKAELRDAHRIILLSSIAKGDLDRKMDKCYRKHLDKLHENKKRVQKEDDTKAEQNNEFVKNHVVNQVSTTRKEYTVGDMQFSEEVTNLRYASLNVKTSMQTIREKNKK